MPKPEDTKKLMSDELAKDLEEAKCPSCLRDVVVPKYPARIAVCPECGIRFCSILGRAPRCVNCRTPVLPTRELVDKGSLEYFLAGIYETKAQEYDRSYGQETHRVNMTCPRCHNHLTARLDLEGGGF